MYLTSFGLSNSFSSFCLEKDEEDEDEGDALYTL